MTAEKSITDLLAAPLRPDWTIEELAEQLLCTIASHPKGEATKLLLDAESTTDRQSQRLLRPLLACLATKSAAEAGTPPNLYGGQLSFKRAGADGPIWILGEFENKHGSVRVAFRRTSSPPRDPESTDRQLVVSRDLTPRPADPLPTSTSGAETLADK